MDEKVGGTFGSSAKMQGSIIQTIWRTFLQSWTISFVTQSASMRQGPLLQTSHFVEDIALFQGLVPSVTKVSLSFFIHVGLTKSAAFIPFPEGSWELTLMSTDIHLYVLSLPMLLIAVTQEPCWILSMTA